MLSVCKVAGRVGAGTKEESGEIWTLVTLRRLPLVTTRPQHPGVGVAGLLVAGADLERSCKKRMPPLGCTSPLPPHGHVILVAFRV